MDGKITGRLIRHNYYQHQDQETGTLYLTLVKSRGSYRTPQGEVNRATSDFLTFEMFIDDTPGAINKLTLLQKLSDENTLVEVTYSLKSTTYNDTNGDRIYKEYKQLHNFEILESKQAVKDRISHQKNNIADQETSEENTVFDPEEAGAFVQNEVSEHLKQSKPKTTSEGKYGNPFTKNKGD